MDPIAKSKRTIFHALHHPQKVGTNPPTCSRPGKCRNEPKPAASPSARICHSRNPMQTWGTNPFCPMAKSKRTTCHSLHHPQKAGTNPPAVHFPLLRPQPTHQYRNEPTAHSPSTLPQYSRKNGQPTTGTGVPQCTGAHARRQPPLAPRSAQHSCRVCNNEERSAMAWSARERDENGPHFEGITAPWQTEMGMKKRRCASRSPDRLYHAVADTRRVRWAKPLDPRTRPRAKQPQASPDAWSEAAAYLPSGFNRRLRRHTSLTPQCQAP